MRRVEPDPYQVTRTEPFTNPEMQRMSGVSLMSLHLWRRGTATKTKLPAQKDGQGRVRYPVRSTIAWMRRHGIVPAVHPDALAAQKNKSGPTPGRKPAAAAAAAHN
jgi:hypothetical protein